MIEPVPEDIPILEKHCDYCHKLLPCDYCHKLFNVIIQTDIPTRSIRYICSKECINKSIKEYEISKKAKEILEFCTKNNINGLRVQRMDNQLKIKLEHRGIGITVRKIK